MKFASKCTKKEHLGSTSAPGATNGKFQIDAYRGLRPCRGSEVARSGAGLAHSTFALGGRHFNHELLTLLTKGWNSTESSIHVVVGLPVS
jgi:hypothetical protein